MHEVSDIARTKLTYSYFHEKLVASFIALENFLAEIRSASGREEMLALTLSHLESLLPIRIAGFYFPNEGDLEFSLHTALPPEAAQQLQVLVDRAIDTGVFGWAMRNMRPAALKTPDGMTTLILAALRTRQRVLGMFAAILATSTVSAWDANAIMLTTHLACAADAIFSEELTVKLQEHNRTLDSIVQQRTHQLQEAKEAAEIATRAKSRFLATVSHELRTPLNAILGYSQIMRDSEPMTASQLARLSTIRQSAEHLLSLINDLLDLSKAEATSLEIVPCPVQLRELIQDTQSIIQPLARDKALLFQCEIDSGVPAVVTVDPKRLRQVLINLLGNAVKFTQQGSVQLKVFRVDDRLRFLISDTGIGIAAEDMPKLFQPFQQMGSSDQKAAGTGLGLSICKRILQAMKGDLQVQSEQGKGTSFQFDLALEAGNPLSAGPETRVAPLDAAPSPDLTPDWVAPPLEQVCRLKQLAASGDILELRKELEKQLRDSSPPHPWISKLLKLAIGCKIKLIREELGKV